MSQPSQERLMKMGLITQLQQQLQALTYRAEGILSSIGSSTFVYASPFDLDAARVVSYAAELKQVVDEGNALRVRIEKLKGELGLP